MTKRVRAFVPDLMDRSRLRAPEASVEFVADPAALLDEPADLFVLDLARSDALLAISDRSVWSGLVVGFAPHVDDEAMAVAREAGCDEVLPRSVFFRRFPDLGPDA